MGENKEGQTEIEKLCSEIYRTIQEGNPKPSFSRIEDKLAWLILEQRYHNLSEFIQSQCKKYHSNDSKELLELWFRYNDLKEIQFIGTDLYANAVFVKHKVPYLYRSVGKGGENRVPGEKVKANEMGEKIFTECLEQIKSGGKGDLYSYSKCFGKMLYKYANILYWSDGNTKIEIRKDAYVNTVSEDGYHTEKSLQRYIRETKTDAGGTETEREIPFFAVDMSNARDNSVANLKRWLDGFLGKQEYITRFHDIYDPIGDAEVVMNFTSADSSSGQSVLCSGVERFRLSKEEFCVLLYRYFSKYKQENLIWWYHDREDCEEKTKTGMIKFQNFIQESVSTIQDSRIKEFYESVLNQSIPNIDDCKLQKILENIDWEREIFYMRRKKSEKGSADGGIAQMEIYKSDATDHETGMWKDILFAAVEGKYSHINYAGQREE